VFGNLSWYHLVVLLLLALFIFGDKLPQIVTDGLRLLRNLRRMAQNATTDLSRELGTDIQLEDLHPKAFIRKHILSEADQEALVKPLKGVSDDVIKQTRGVERDLRDVGKEAQQAAGDLNRANRRGGRGGRGGDANGGRTGLNTKPTSPGGPADLAPTPPAPAPAVRPSYDDIT
jgi:sec-independent protein translocase protein TatB